MTDFLVLGLKRLAVEGAPSPQYHQLGRSESNGRRKRRRLPRTVAPENLIILDEETNSIAVPTIPLNKAFWDPENKLPVRDNSAVLNRNKYYFHEGLKQVFDRIGNGHFLRLSSVSKEWHVAYKASGHSHTSFSLVLSHPKMLEFSWDKRMKEMVAGQSYDGRKFRQAAGKLPVGRDPLDPTDPTKQDPKAVEAKRAK